MVWSLWSVYRRSHWRLQKNSSLKGWPVSTRCDCCSRTKEIAAYMTSHPRNKISDNHPKSMTQERVALLTNCKFWTPKCIFFSSRKKKLPELIHAKFINRALVQPSSVESWRWRRADVKGQSSSAVTSLFKTRLTKPKSNQRSGTAAKPGLSGLLVGLSPICPSLNKHKGVFGRQLHFASRGKGKPKHMAEVNASDNSFLSPRLLSSKTQHENGYGWNFKSLALVSTQEA